MCYQSNFLKHDKTEPSLSKQSQSQPAFFANNIKFAKSSGISASFKFALVIHVTQINHPASDFLYTGRADVLLSVSLSVNSFAVSFEICAVESVIIFVISSKFLILSFCGVKHNSIKSLLSAPEHRATVLVYQIYSQYTKEKKNTSAAKLLRYVFAISDKFIMPRLF